MPRETSPTLCPARPTRCSPLATEGGASTWTTRSTAPMSMPSSRLEVATTAGSRPALSASSISARSCRDTDPWCARATSGGRARRRARLRHDLGRRSPFARAQASASPAASAASPAASARSAASSFSRPHSRSASRRELANTIVDLCCSIRSSTRSSTCGQMDRAGAGPSSSPPPAARRGVQVGHVLDRDDHGQLDALGARRLHHRHRPGAAEERRDLLHRPHGRGQPHPLRGAGACPVRTERRAVPGTAPGARPACSPRPRAPRPR